MFAAISSGAATFGNEQVIMHILYADMYAYLCVYVYVYFLFMLYLFVKVNYFREAAAGLQTFPYFLGKWIANFPRVVRYTEDLHTHTHTHIYIYIYIYALRRVFSIMSDRSDLRSSFGWPYPFALPTPLRRESCTK
jgi:hypothetical protein